MRIILSAILFILFFPFFSFSQLRLPAVLSSGMVLQQNDSVSIWGWGNNSETMSITGSWDNKTYTTVVSNQGSWNRKIKTGDEKRAKMIWTLFALEVWYKKCYLKNA